jgi:hypothetical protein
VNYFYHNKSIYINKYIKYLSKYKNIILEYSMKNNLIE